MSAPWSPTLRRSLTATLPVANESLDLFDRRHVLFVSPRFARSIARDGEGRAILHGRGGFFLAGAPAASHDASGAVAAGGFSAGAFAATGSVT